MLNNQFVQLLELSTRDDLSKLLNRRGFFNQADKQVRLAQRLKQHIGILYLDLDHLKTINDEYGHRIGDKAIGALATAIRNVIRESDVAGRIGGDEFVIVMLADGEESLTKLTLRIRQELRQQAQGELEHIELSVSVGSQLFRHPHSFSIDKMVSEVDRCMYRDKTTNHRLAEKEGLSQRQQAEMKKAPPECPCGALFFNAGNQINGPGFTAVPPSSAITLPVM